MQRELRDAQSCPKRCCVKATHISNLAPSHSHVMPIARNWGNGENVSAGSPNPTLETLSEHVTDHMGSHCCEAPGARLCRAGCDSPCSLRGADGCGPGVPAQALTRPKWDLKVCRICCRWALLRCVMMSMMVPSSVPESPKPHGSEAGLWPSFPYAPH